MGRRGREKDDGTVGGVERGVFGCLDCDVDVNCECGVEVDTDVDVDVDVDWD